MKRETPVKPRMKWRLGSAGSGFIFLAPILVGLAIYTQATLLFWACGLMVAALVVSFVLSGAVVSGVSVERLLPDHGVAGEQVRLRYRLVNRKLWIPVFSLAIEERWGRGRRGWKRQGPVAESPPRLKGPPAGWMLHMGPDQILQAEAPCWPLRRGELVFEKVVLASSFPFGLIRREAIFELPGKLLVYPHLYRVHRRLLFRILEMDPLANRQVQKSGGSEEFYGLRPYRPGDSLRMIDWKRTARTGELVAREMTLPSPPRVMIALDLREWDGQGPEGYHAVERAVSLAASLVCDAYFNACHVGLVVKGAKGPVFPVHHSLPHRTRLLESLAMLDAAVRRTRDPALTTPPTVEVRPGGEDALNREARRVILSADHMHAYVTDPLQGGEVLLERRAPPVRQRRQRPPDEALA